MIGKDPASVSTERPDESARQDNRSAGAVGMYLETAMEAISREQFPQALEILNRAILDATEVQLAECYSLRGFVRLKMEDFDLAEDDCSSAIARRGYDPETLSWRAAARAERGDWRAAFEDLKHACDADPDKGQIHRQTMESWLPTALEALEPVRASDDKARLRLSYDSGCVALLAGDLEQATRHLEAARAIARDHGPSLIGLARIAMQNKDFVEAIRLTSQAMQADPDSLAEALSCRAECYAKQGDLALAIEDVTRLREITVDEIEGLLLCASLRERLGDHSGAIDDLDLARRLKPDMPAVLAARGDAYARIRNYEMALADYSEYLEYVPGDERVWLKQANMHLQLGHLEKARDGFDRALDIDDICAAAYVGRCKVMTKMHNHAQGLVESERALRLDSRNPETWLLRGLIFHEQQRYGQAEADFGRALELTDDAAKRGEILFRRGISRYEGGKYSQAIEDFRASGKARPTHAGTHVWQAATSARFEDWTDVIENLYQAMRLRPSATQQYRKLGSPVARKAAEFFTREIREGKATRETYRSRGRAYEFLGRADDACLDYVATLTGDDDDCETVIALARLRNKKGEHERAGDDLTGVLRRDPNCHAAYHARAALMIDVGDLDAAARDIKRAIEIAPTQARYHVTRGDIRLIANNPQAAIDDYTQAIALDPADHLAFRKRGSCYTRLHKRLLAIADLTRSLELFPGLAETLILRGQAYLKNEQFSQANADFENALMADPNQVRAFAGRGNCLACLGQHEEALIWLTKAFYRFTGKPRSIAELLMMRGKIFYQMGRFAPAIADFSTVIDLQADDPFGVAAARAARGIALVQSGDLIRGKKEFDRVLKRFPEHPIAGPAVRWLSGETSERPAALLPPIELVRPTRPPVMGNPHVLPERETAAASADGDTHSPLELWLVRTRKPAEYGPVSRSVLDDWVRQGRIDHTAKLLKTGWEKWRRAKRVYPSLDKPGNGKVTQAKPPQ